MTSQRAHHIAVIGLGNVGSQLAPLVARMPGVGTLTLIDHDSYSPENLASQNIGPGDAGFAKALVMAQRLREGTAHMRATPLVQRVEDVPLGVLRADVIVACVDSLAARLTISEAAWRLGVPCVDTGVHADGALARVTVQVPGEDRPCLQCAWSERDYARLEQRYVCLASAPSFATNAPAWLGGLAAALAVGEIARLLDGDRSSAGMVFLLDARHHRFTATRVLRRAECRFDHAAWPIVPLGSSAHETSVGALLARGGNGHAGVSAWNRPWVGQRVCPACQRTEIAWHLRGRRADACACGGALLPLGFRSTAALVAADLPPGLLAQPLSTLGVRDGDVLTLTQPGASAYLQVGATL